MVAGARRKPAEIGHLGGLAWLLHIHFQIGDANRHKVSGNKKGYIMKNVKIETKGATLVITINMNEKGEPSKSGKNATVASTHGFIGAGSGRLSLNFIKELEG